MATRRSAGQWQFLIDSYSQSELTALKFCEQESISYQSFMNWKKRLDPNGLSKQAALSAEPSFVKLTQQSDPEPLWHIELDLAPGIQLRIARPA